MEPALEFPLLFFRLDRRTSFGRSTYSCHLLTQNPFLLRVRIPSVEIVRRGILMRLNRIARMTGPHFLMRAPASRAGNVNKLDENTNQITS
jgi:hypothetical protein